LMRWLWYHGTDVLRILYNYYASFHGRTTVSVTEVSVLQASVCGTACHRTYDKT